MLPFGGGSSFVIEGLPMRETQCLFAIHVRKERSEKGLTLPAEGVSKSRVFQVKQSSHLEMTYPPDRGQVRGYQKEQNVVLVLMSYHVFDAFLP